MCYSQRSQLGGVRIILLHTCWWMNRWNNLTRRGAQLTSVQLFKAWPSVCAFVCHHNGCTCHIYILRCVRSLLFHRPLCCVFVFVYEGAVAGTVSAPASTGYSCSEEAFAKIFECSNHGNKVSLWPLMAERQVLDQMSFSSGQRLSWSPAVVTPLICFTQDIWDQESLTREYLDWTAHFRQTM